jgi:hypothetical protein
VRRADAPHGRSTRIGGNKELRPTMGGIRSVLGMAVSDKEVCRPLRALASHADVPRDVGDRPPGSEHGAQQQPRRRGQRRLTCQLLTDRMELAVQLEYGLGQRAEKILVLAHVASTY